MRYGVVGNGHVLAIVMPDLEVAFLGTSEASAVWFDRAVNPGGASLRLSAGGRMPEPGVQAYVGESGVLRTVTRIGAVEIDATDYLPFERPLFLRDMTIVNRSDAEVPFVLTAEAVAVPPNVTVLRDGRRILTAPISETNPEELVRAMVGRELKDYFPERESRARGAPLFRVEGLTAPGRFYDITFTIHRGEIVGLAGLVGAGRTELVEALFGAGEYTSGKIFIEERPVTIRTPADAIRHGLALVTDDRKAKGLIPTASVQVNIILPVQARVAHFGFLVNARAERHLTERLLRELRVKTPSADHPVMLLSGGNQQKVVLARWLAVHPRVLLMDEPTRGIDVGAKMEIYELIRRLAAQGTAILLVSSELEELRHLADRILVMHRGRIVGELQREEATDDRILYLATGGEG